MKIIKRNGTNVEFEKEKIQVAISKANKELQLNEQISDQVIEDIATKIFLVCQSKGHEPTVEEVQDMVIDEIASRGYFVLMRSYASYRYKRELLRKANTTDSTIISLVQGKNNELNTENSNKSTILNSTQRDYIAGEVSKDISKRVLLPEKIAKAHEDGILHFHDLDYHLQPMHNCFRKDTKFVTKDGIRSFDEFQDGEKTYVLDMNGDWRLATIRNYGKQQMQTVVLKSGRSIRTVECTKNHRWILKDGSVTTNLKKGDILWPSHEISLCWIVDKITHGCDKMQKNYEFEAWCVEEPVTHSFTLEGGIVTGNCCLVDIDDILVNGTVMNGKMIESPKTFQVACTVATQVMAAVASNQYGGQSIDLSHFGKFLRRSKEKFEKRIRETSGNNIDEATIQNIIDRELKDELSAGVQTIQYQINTLMTTNGQAPFVTLFMYLNNEKEKEYIEENAMIFEEVLKQRLQGIKNKVGVYITPAFPKLIYVLDENNNLKGGKYDYLTKLAVKCTAKRMYPDYISAKKMREYYEGNVYSCMGCLDYAEGIVYDYNGIISVESIGKIWEKMTQVHIPKLQRVDDERYKYIDIGNMELKVYDTKLKSFTPVYRIIKNWATDWRKIKFSNGKCIMVTYDHPFETENRGVVYAKDLQYEDLILYNPNPVTDSTINLDVDKEFLCHPTEIEVVNKSDWSYDFTTESEHFEVDGIYSHNCRSFLSPWVDEFGNYKFEGRFNQGVVSINLPQIGIVSNGDEDVFWQELDNRLELCYEALIEKHKNCKRILSDNSPIHFQHGAISRLGVHESIDKLLYGGYSTLSLGYIGLYELTKLMKGCSHTDPDGTKFALDVMHHLRETVDRWKKETTIGFALYGTPAESLCKRFCDIDARRFGIIKDVTDKGWYTNSYHVDVREHIDAFAKLKFESQFQPISSGGCISYIEIPNMGKNLQALEEMIMFIYDNILYAECNTKSDYCQVCGFDGEITLNENHEWQCPQCGNKDKALMNVTRRTCGYLGENFWNDKKTLEIENRVLHTS